MRNRLIEDGVDLKHVFNMHFDRGALQPGQGSFLARAVRSYSLDFPGEKF